MNTIFDQYGVDLLKDNELSDEEIKALFALLSKLDPESMDCAISWSSATAEYDGDRYYRFAIENFFSIHTANIVSKHFGDDISCMCQETEHSDFKELSFVKIMKAMAEELDVQKFVLPKPNIIVINQ